VLSYQINDALRDGLLRTVLESFESEPLPLSLVYKEQAPMPLKLRAFLDFVTPLLRNRLLR
jgi:DNA-binding transcriptional LysR family regulator